MKLQKQDHLRNMKCMKCLRGTAWNKGGWFMCGCGASYIPSLDKWTDSDKPQNNAPEGSPDVKESIKVRRTLNREGFRETVVGDNEDAEMVKVSRGLEKHEIKKSGVAKARNDLAAELFKRRMKHAAADAGFKPKNEGYDPKELAKGAKEEREHTHGQRFKELKKAVDRSPHEVANTIAKQHLRDKPDYYTKLTKAGLAEAITAIKSGKNLDEVITEAALALGSGKAYVMVPHSAKTMNGNPVTKDYLTRATGSDRRSGQVHDKDYAHSGGEKHHCVEFSCRKHAEMFKATLHSSGIDADHKIVESAATDVFESGEKKFTKTIKDKKTGRTRRVRYGEKGSDIRPGTSKGDAYCARSAKIKGDWKSDPNSPNNLSRRKWKCRGSKSMR